MIELVASIGQRIGFSRLSRAEHRDQTFVLVDRQGDLMLGYGALFLVFALLGGVSTGLVAFSNKALATLVGNITTGLMIFCLVATAYHGLLAIYSGRKFSRYHYGTNFQWLSVAQRVDYVLLVAIMAIWLATQYLR